MVEINQTLSVPMEMTPPEKVRGVQVNQQLQGVVTLGAENASYFISDPSRRHAANEMNTPAATMPFWVGVRGFPLSGDVVRNLPYLPGNSQLNYDAVTPGAKGSRGLYHLLKGGKK